MGQTDPPAAAPSPTHVRFGVLGFACTLSLLTYLDRICIMRVQDEIRDDLGFSKTDMGWVFGAFALGYCVFEVPGGWMGDVRGARRVLVRVVVWWSLFTALTGYVDQILGLALGSNLLTPALLLGGMLTVRFLFGCGEAGAYPNLARVVGSWFPFRERGLAQGSIWMSARLGGALAPLVIGQLSAALGWRAAFGVLGLLGGAWAVCFWTWYRNTPEEQPACNEEERRLIRSGPYSWQADVAATGHARPPWGRLLRSGNVWALCLAAFCLGFGWYFYPSWQPTYLKDVYAISFGDSELLTGLPFLCGAVGSLLGGGLSDRLTRWTGSRRWGRSLLGLAGAAGAGLCVLATGFAASPGAAVLLLCLAFFINDLAIPPLWAASTDIGGRFAGTVSGIMNMANALGGFLSMVLTPYLRQAFPEGAPPAEQWRVVFAVLASAWFVATLAWLGIDASRPIVQAEAPPKTSGEWRVASGE